MCKCAAQSGAALAARMKAHEAAGRAGAEHYDMRWFERIRRCYESPLRRLPYLSAEMQVMKSEVNPIQSSHRLEQKPAVTFALRYPSVVAWSQ
jgi:hypothetical protein